jgi:aminopeptidase N
MQGHCFRCSEIFFYRGDYAFYRNKEKQIGNKVQRQKEIFYLMKGACLCITKSKLAINKQIEMKQFLKTVLIINYSMLIIAFGQAQPLGATQKFTHADTLRGTYGASRNWWDVLKYDLHVSFNIPDSTISGKNIIHIWPLKSGSTIQIDLQEPMILDSVEVKFTTWKIRKQQPRKIQVDQTDMLRTNEIRKDGNAYFISTENRKSLAGYEITAYFHGRPRIARRPPWDGGVIWSKSADNSPWISVACQNLGASVWYPCKDHQSDEPDSAALHITCPDSLTAVGNGRFRGKTNNSDGTATYNWTVTSPINNYCIIPYIGKYVHFSEAYKGEQGNIDMDYWVLEENLEKAKKQFVDCAKMMKAFEHWFGPYPFMKDGYKLVDAPHLGMEHQSATAYGNKYKNGYLGRDLSGTGWGLKWDFIIVHESGHEWFANNITTKDIADMWVHEGFTNYSETLFTDYWFGTPAGNEYCIGTRKGIQNDIPIIGIYNVNQEGSGDMYPKAGNMLHTIRQVIDSDEKFRQLLRGLNKTFYHQTVTTQQVENFINKKSGKNFNAVFNQYLRTTMIPVLQYKIKDMQLSFRYDSCVTGFNLPIKVAFNNTDKKEQWLKPTTNWQSISLPAWWDKKTVIVNPNFYVKSKLIE